MAKLTQCNTDFYLTSFLMVPSIFSRVSPLNIRSKFHHFSANSTRDNWISTFCIDGQISSGLINSRIRYLKGMVSEEPMSFSLLSQCYKTYKTLTNTSYRASLINIFSIMCNKRIINIRTVVLYRN